MPFDVLYFRNLVPMLDGCCVMGPSCDLMMSSVPIPRPMTADQAMRSDDLYRARWLSLLSVDDLVGEFVATLTAAGVVDNTYFLFTSDHGFRFGQYR